MGYKDLVESMGLAKGSDLKKTEMGPPVGLITEPSLVGQAPSNVSGTHLMAIIHIHL